MSTGRCPTTLARVTGQLIPNDEGAGHAPGDWQALQWNFEGQFSVDAPEAWANVAADGAPGGAGVTVAVLDTGVAYANRGPFRRSPDFSRYTFVQGYDFVAHNPYPNDRNGHGTFVAGTIAEATDNHIGLTGLAYGAHIMPVRVLDSQGEGDAGTIAEGVRFAVNHHAQVINLSLEFSSDVTASDIPELIEALRYAHRRGVLVVAAAGNEGHAAIAYPARAPDVIAVGATTEHGCLANYSNDGTGLTLVAPGGGADADLPGDPNCKPAETSGARRLPDDLRGLLAPSFRPPAGLRRNLDGRSACRGDGRADHRQPCARSPSDAGADHRRACARPRRSWAAAAMNDSMAADWSTRRPRRRPEGPGPLPSTGAPPHRDKCQGGRPAGGPLCTACFRLSSRRERMR